MGKASDATKMQDSAQKMGSKLQFEFLDGTKNHKLANWFFDGNNDTPWHDFYDPKGTSSGDRMSKPKG